MGELGLNLAIGLVTTSCCGCQTAWCWLWWLSPVKAAMVGVGLYKNKICCYLQVVKLLKQSNLRSAIVSFPLFRSLIFAILRMVTHCPAFMKINAPRKRLHVEWWGQKFIISFWTYQFERVQRKFSELYSEWVSEWEAMQVPRRRTLIQKNWISDEEVVCNIRNKFGAANSLVKMTLLKHTCNKGKMKTNT